MKFQHALIAAAALSASAAPALADDEPADPVSTSGGGGSGGLGGNYGGGSGTSIWSPQLIRNPVTLNKGGIEIFGSFAIGRFTEKAADPTMMDTVTTVEGFAAGVGYGITDKITAGLTYAVRIHDPDGSFPSDDRWKGPLGVYAGFNLKHDGKMSLSIGGDYKVNLGNTDNQDIGLGASFKYYLSDTFAVFTGNPLPAGPVGQHLTIGLEDKGPIAIHIPAGVMFQATPQLFAYLDTRLMDIEIANSDTGVIFADFIPVDLGVFYHATTDLDVGINFADDFKNAGDSYAFALTALLHL